MTRLQGKIALVTGAARGLGKAISDRMTDAGAHVIRADISDFNGAGTDGGSTIRLDVSSEDQWRNCAARIEQEHGHLDILVNNAGISPGLAFADMTLEIWRRVFAVNMEGVFLGCLTMLPLLKAAGQKRPAGASIINLSSIAGARGMPRLAAYGASKAGVDNLTKHLAIEFARERFNIRINSIQATATLTDLLRQTVRENSLDGADEEQMLEFSASLNPLGRLGTPDEIALACVFLASDEASFVNGVPLPVDGGAAAQ